MGVRDDERGRECREAGEYYDTENDLPRSHLHALRVAERATLSGGGGEDLHPGVAEYASNNSHPVKDRTASAKLFH